MDTITQLNSALSGRYELEREVGDEGAEDGDAGRGFAWHGASKLTLASSSPQICK